MKIRKQLLSGNRLYQIGYNVTLFGTAAILLWIGIFKFTPTEAAAIRPLIEYHPFSFWAYDMFGQQSVSNFVGIVEISLAVVLLLSIKFHSLSLYAGVGIVCTFLVKLHSRLFHRQGFGLFGVRVDAARSVNVQRQGKTWCGNDILLLNNIIV